MSTPGKGGGDERDESRTLLFHENFGTLAQAKPTDFKMDILPMKLTVLGSGSSWPDSKRGAPACALEVDGALFLIDAGEGCTRAMAATGLDWRAVDAVLLTHYHNDHVSGLIPFLFALHVFPGREKPLTIFGPPGLADYMDAQRGALAPWLANMPIPVNLREIGNENRIDLTGAVTATAFEVMHKKVSVGYRIEHAGRKIGFSGDSSMCEALIRIASDANLFVCESGYPDEKLNTDHLSWSQVGQVANQARVGQLMLTHFGENADPSALVERIGERYAGPVTLGYDGLQIEL